MTISDYDPMNDRVLITRDYSHFDVPLYGAKIGDRLRNGPTLPKPDEKGVWAVGSDPAKPGPAQAALVIYDTSCNQTRPAIQADIDRLQARVKELFKQACDQQWTVHGELVVLRRMIEDANDGKPLWFQKPIKGDVLSGHQWTGSEWLKLQMVEPDPEIDRIWDTVKAASRA